MKLILTLFTCLFVTGCAYAQKFLGLLHEQNPTYRLSIYGECGQAVDLS